MLPLVESMIVLPGRQRAGADRVADHLVGGAVLDRAARVEELALGPDLDAGRVALERVQPDERRVADEVGDPLGHAHPGAPDDVGVADHRRSSDLLRAAARGRRAAGAGGGSRGVELGTAPRARARCSASAAASVPASTAGRAGRRRAPRPTNGALAARVGRRGACAANDTTSTTSACAAHDDDREAQRRGDARSSRRRRSRSARPGRRPRRASRQAFASAARPGPRRRDADSCADAGRRAGTSWRSRRRGRCPRRPPRAPRCAPVPRRRSRAARCGARSGRRPPRTTR